MISIQHRPIAMRFAAEQTPPKPPVKTNPISKGLNILGTTALVTGIAWGIGGAVHANIKHDGKLNLVPVSAQEAHKQQLAAIPGLMFILSGSLLRQLGRTLKRVL